MCNVLYRPHDVVRHHISDMCSCCWICNVDILHLLFSVVGHWWSATISQYVGTLLSRRQCYCVRYLYYQ